jgi:dihydrofolate reductase
MEGIMRRVIVGAFVSMDGVMQAPGGPQEDPSGGFAFGGWVAPLADTDPVFREEIGDLLFGKPYDLLLGRRTYEIFAAYGPTSTTADEIAKQFNRATKYVLTASGDDDTSWNKSVMLRDGARDVAKLKKEDGPALVTQGSTKLVHTLLASGMVDELRVFMFPVLLGKGKRLFADDGQPSTFKLTQSRVSSNGSLSRHMCLTAR